VSHLAAAPRCRPAIVTFGFEAAGKLGKASVAGAAGLTIDLVLGGPVIIGVVLALEAPAQGTDEAFEALAAVAFEVGSADVELALALVPVTAPQPRDWLAALAAKARWLCAVELLSFKIRRPAGIVFWLGRAPFGPGKVG